MKKHIYTLLFLFCLFLSYAQTGINNKFPLGTFHIDAKGDNPANSLPNAQQQANDVIITTEGNVGIGTTAPSNKLVIDNGISNQTGLNLPFNASEGRILTSDNQGIASWTSKSNVKVILADRNATTHPEGITLPINSRAFYYTGWSITLPPGRWEITVNMALNFGYAPAIPEGVSVWFRSSFKDDTTEENNYSVDSESPMLVSGTLNGPKPANTLKYVMNVGSIILNNRSSSPKTYYYAAGYNEYTNFNTTTDYQISAYGANLGCNIIYAVALN